MKSAWGVYRAFTPPPARALKWPEVIHFQCEPAASSSESGKSGAARLGRCERQGELKGLVHPKMKMMSLITHPHVVLNP